MANETLYAIRLKDGSFYDLPRCLWDDNRRAEQELMGAWAMNPASFGGARVVPVELVERPDGE